MYTEDLTHEMRVAQIALVDIFGNGDFDLIPMIYSSDWVGNESRGHKGRQDFIAYIRSAFPDIKFTIDGQVQDTDAEGKTIVVTRWTATGTHKGDLLGISPTGKNGTVTGITWDQFDEKNLIIQSWAEWSDLKLFFELQA